MLKYIAYSFANTMLELYSIFFIKKIINFFFFFLLGLGKRFLLDIIEMKQEIRYHLRNLISKVNGCDHVKWKSVCKE